MTDQINRGNVEAEIAELSRQIEEKRRMLEAGHGIVEEKELVRHVVAEKIGEVMGQAMSITPPTTSPSASSKVAPVVKAKRPTYLDTLDNDAVAKINALMATIFEKGISQTIKQVVEEDPFILDAFHDALVDKLYDELKNHNLIN
ncbi:MAG: hypothetical protein HZA95_03445 [Candidatus Vogelbacteria bacterium]|nr:hypothetical protein [Candidatus Vogelbacteria bacterium]